MAPSKNIWVVSVSVRDRASVAQVAFTNEEDANAEAQGLLAKHDPDEKCYTSVAKVELKEGGTTSAPKPKKQSAPKKQSSAATETHNARKEIPEGKPNALEGLKLLFTGTFDAMDRDTSKATAEKYGATVLNPNKITETDYVILGTKAGAKKLEEIKSHDLETLNEGEFFDMLQNGVSAEKRQQMDAKEAAQDDAKPAKKKQKK